MRTGGIRYSPYPVDYIAMRNKIYIKLIDIKIKMCFRKV